MRLNLDGGEHDDEPVQLYGLADVVHLACGGHAGDRASMDRVVAECLRVGTAVGAHPSYVDRPGFGRRDVEVAPDVLEEQLAEQCAALAEVARSQGAGLMSAKPHGALYHAAHRDGAIARACVAAARRALGRVPIVGLAGGALEAEARREGHRFFREAFADRGVRADGTLVPRGEPGAILGDPAAAAARARALVASGGADMLCVHADTGRAAVAIAEAVRAALGPRGHDPVR
jgi:UPF0271 protein